MPVGTEVAVEEGVGGLVVLAGMMEGAERHEQKVGVEVEGTYPG